MSDFSEMACALELARTSTEAGDKASAYQALAEISGVSAVRARLQGEGQDDCDECGCDIPQARRQAMPSAIRCAPCQEAVEAKGRVWRG